MSMADYNKTIIEEFRANEGKVGGNFEGRPVLLLTTKGAKSGNQHTTPVMYLDESGSRYVFATPTVTLEVGTEKYGAKATPVDRAERDRVYAIMAAKYPNFAEYEEKTTRVIPVVELEKA